MTDTGSNATHPGLTITVYRVNSETLERTPLGSRTLPAVDEPVINLAFPPCECPRCKAGTAAR